MKALITICTAALFLISCNETKKVIDVAGNVQLAGNYTITSLGETSVTENAPNITFLALDKSVKGNTGCNSFFGNYSLDLYALSFIDIAATERACDEPIMTNENMFLQALYNTGSYSLEENVLTLFSKNDRSVLLKAQKEVNQ
ncbi:MAG: META domain-containing protein [Bacteroidia bacterium]|nr:META domain-containing protein [Bacteroidia bacterium]NNF30940.1 META domain-containing protein [Flavobacteriaceae bacterium]MBT8275730.1 META domain-containing protein [Bacteroidia bacterium]NNJ82347.1 META domain-containing protein [Flavobacteriaceae bacterium]NNK54666.1 META domain-containing protein [Flavobacteriaceae bacterium]